MRAVLLAFTLTTLNAATPYMRGVNVSGAEFGNNVIPGTYGHEYWYNSPPTFEYFAARNLGFIRLQVLWERLQPTLFGPLDIANLDYLKNDIAWAKAAGAQISIDVHNFARYSMYQNGKLFPYVIDNPYNGTVLVPAGALADFWVRMSTEFKNEPTVVAYDIMNEPHDMGPANWNHIAQTVLSAIRANNDTKLIMIPGDSYSSAAFWPQNQGPTSWIIDPANNFIYQAHLYFDFDSSGTYKENYDQELARNPDLANVGVTRFQPFRDWCTTNAVRCYVGEYGIPYTTDDPRWLAVLNTFMNALDAAGFSGTYWAAGEWWGEFDPMTVQPTNNFTQDRAQTRILLQHLTPGRFTTLSSAANFGYAVAPGTLAAGYGANLATGMLGAPSLPLGTSLLGTRVQLTDSNSAVTFAPLLFVSPGQVNYEVPPAIPPGRVDVQVVNNGTSVASGVLEVKPLAPTIFSADGSGTGIAAAQITRVQADGTQTITPVTTTPIVFGTDRIILVLYGTGFDHASGPGGVTIQIGNTTVPAQFIGVQPQYAGLDQINAELPVSLTGAGQVNVAVTIDGLPANTVTITFQ